MSTLISSVFSLNHHRTLLWSVLAFGFLRLTITAAAQETWKWELLDPLAGSPDLLSIAYGNGRFVAVGLQGAVFTSSDGRQWAKQSVDASLDLGPVTFGNGLFVAQGSRQVGWHTPSIAQFEAILLTSPDGINWTTQWAKTDVCLWDMLWANRLFVAVGYNYALSPSYPLGIYSGTVFTSVSGQAWVEGTAPVGAGTLCDVTYGHGEWLIRTDGGDAWLSNNARDWVQCFHAFDLDHLYGPSDSGNSISSDITFIESWNEFVFVGTSINGDHTEGLWVNTSSDARDWLGAITCSTEKGPGTYAPMRTVLGLDGGLVFVGDGIVTANANQTLDNMTMVQFATPVEFSAVAASPAVIVAVGPSGTIAVADRQIDHSLTITTQPQNQMAAVGTEASFNVIATGAGVLIFQWRKDGVNLPGATNSSYTITEAQANLAGAYSVVVSNAYGSVISSEAVLTVIEPLRLATEQMTFQPGGVSWTLNVPLGVRIILEASTDLRQWETVADTVTSTSTVKINDSVVIASRARFYRVKYLLP